MEYKQITLTEIYIPICFYFNTIRFFTCIICTNIYIPICFYFNAKSFVKSSYVLLFTFQYVSILMHCIIEMMLMQEDLHSNMFLF